MLCSDRTAFSIVSWVWPYHANETAYAIGRAYRTSYCKYLVYVMNFLLTSSWRCVSWQFLYLDDMITMSTFPAA